MYNPLTHILYVTDENQLRSLAVKNEVVEELPCECLHAMHILKFSYSNY